MGQKHATRNELAQAFIDMWLTLNFRVCGNTPVMGNSVVVDKRASRAQLHREIMNMKLEILGLLSKYQDLMHDEVNLNNRRCAKNKAKFADKNFL